MMTMSQNDGMYAPPAADGPNRQQIWGTLPDSRTWFAKILPAPRRPGNRSTWSVIRAPAESMSQKMGTSWRSAYSVTRIIFSTVRAPHEPAFTVGSFATTHTVRPSTRPTPVTTPSAGRSAAIVLESRPSSTNDPSSSSNARRSRTNSLFWRASFSPSRWRLPEAALCLRCSNSSVTLSPFVRWNDGSAPAVPGWTPPLAVGDTADAVSGTAPRGDRSHDDWGRVQEVTF
ncbi:unannotated protein [freshwater metagenome]|uniref:Unannotated protein n=1 Tax=freshwater metagenome TaxID=449393 RepID=A0A6J7EQ14_9ZZZZ